jgi:hypothetical protein
MRNYTKAVVDARLPTDPDRTLFHPIHSVTVDVLWELGPFLRDQCGGWDNINHVLTFTGTYRSCEALSCEDCMRKVWPNTGSAIIDAVKPLLKRGRSSKSALPVS